MEPNLVSGDRNSDLPREIGQIRFRETEDPVSIRKSGSHMEKGSETSEATHEHKCSVLDAAEKGESLRNGMPKTQDRDERLNNSPRNRSNGIRNYLEIDKKQKELDLTSTESERVCETKRWSYLRSEIEALRFLDVSGQQQKWKEVYHRLGSDIVREYDGLRVPNHRKQHRGNDEQQQIVGKEKDASKIMGEVFSINTMKSLDVLNLPDVGCSDTLACSRNGTDIEEPWDEYNNVNDEDDSSSDEYDNIQRPAFLVEGEPDFESGPPLDGLEYLRRVRWEAAQIPKVKVVKIDTSKLSSEQTPYMPNIPEIAKCPLNLLPSKHWEDAFLADFSELRQAISLLANSCNQPSLTKVGKDSCKQSHCIQLPKKNNPTLSAILGMDAVSRAATLRNSISTLESASVLSRDDCIWLFALCAAVDAPLSAETCASLRCLLRKCSGLLAHKSEHDDEVAMLSILVTIAGKYFGQSDNL